jgi:Activator of Hsp90 ATPase homolog 1-like protein
MTSKDYDRSIKANIPPAQAFDKITRVPDWWTKGFTGCSQKLGDNFTVRFGETFVDFKISELVPDNKIVWEVTDSNLHWLKDKKEWNGTKVVWEVSPEGKSETRVRMTHSGLVPGVECYDRCKEGWDFYVGESLLKLLTEKKGLPDQRIG